MGDFPRHQFDPQTETCRRCQRTLLEIKQAKFAVSCMSDRDIETTELSARRLSEFTEISRDQASKLRTVKMMVHVVNLAAIVTIVFFSIAVSVILRGSP